MKSYNFFAFAMACLAAAVSCSKNTVVCGTVADAPKTTLTIEKLTTLGPEVIDSVKTDASGEFTYRLAVPKGQPEFIYVYRNGVKLTSLLVAAGDKVSFSADTLGTWTVSGSDDCSLVLEAETDFNAFIAGLANCKTTTEFANSYVQYYRSRVKFIISHPYSLACVPVLYQHINEYTPVFAQVTDALYYRSAADSLAKVYPESKYVKALDKEAARLMQQLGLQSALSKAEESGIIDIKIPDINGEPVSLAGVKSKVTILHFWDVANASDKMQMQDVLLPLYREYHKKGLEIYSVGVTYDKATWASVVKAQNFPWINVCDGRGAASTALGVYNVQQLPTSILIVNGEVADAKIAGSLAESVKRVLR